MWLYFTATASIITMAAGNDVSRNDAQSVINLFYCKQKYSEKLMKY